MEFLSLMLCDIIAGIKFSLNVLVHLCINLWLKYRKWKWNRGPDDCMRVRCSIYGCAAWFGWVTSMNGAYSIQCIWDLPVHANGTLFFLYNTRNSVLCIIYKNILNIPNILALHWRMTYVRVLRMKTSKWVHQFIDINRIPMIMFLFKFSAQIKRFL